MPIYEYECTVCQVRFERSQRVNEQRVEVCPECGGTTRRIFHPVGVIFKGSGFYVTDNRKPSTPASAASGSTSGDGGKEPVGAKSESVSTPKVGGEKTESKTGAS